MSTGVGIGALTASGSVVAAGKLAGIIPGRPWISDARWVKLATLQHNSSRRKVVCKKKTQISTNFDDPKNAS